MTAAKEASQEDKQISDLWGSSRLNGRCPDMQARRGIFAAHVNAEGRLGGKKPPKNQSLQSLQGLQTPEKLVVFNGIHQQAASTLRKNIIGSLQ